MCDTIKKPEKRRGKWLLVLGFALSLVALAALLRTPEAAQYVAAAPREQSEQDGEPSGGSALQALSDHWMRKREELADALPRNTLYALCYGTDMAGDASTSRSGTLALVTQGFFDVRTKFLLEGRLPSEQELHDGARVAVLDEQLAFQLFPTTQPTQGRVLIGEAWYRVIGVVRHTRSPGEAEAFGAYIPLMGAEGVRADLVMVEAGTGGLAGAARALLQAGQEVLGNDGDFYDLSKEVMRATMLLRVLTVLFAFYALKWILRGLNARTRRAVDGWREEIRTQYFRRMFPRVAGRCALLLLGYAAILTAGYGVLTLTIRPMYVFTEWIPDVIVEWSSISARAGELIAAAAKPVSIRTPQLTEIRFWGALLRWGVICLLSGTVLFRRWGFRKSRGKRPARTENLE